MKELFSYFKKEKDAAKAYDKKCWEFISWLSKLNFPEKLRGEIEWVELHFAK